MQALSHDLVAQVAASAYSAACVVAFSLALLRLRPPALRTAACLAASAALCLGQPLIYASPTQPAAIGLASLCAMTTWSLWGLLLLPRRQLPQSIMGIFWACFMDGMDGCRAVHARRLARRQTAAHAADPATHAPHADAAAAASAASACPVPSAPSDEGAGAGATAAAEVGPKQRSRGRQLVHVEALPAGTSCPVQHAEHGDGSLPPTPAADSADTGGSDTPAPALLPAAWTLCRLVITYDVGFAALCCGGLFGCMCSAAPLDTLLSAPQRLGPLAQIFGPRAAYVAWALAAGTLLPLQMGIAYALTRLALIAAARWGAPLLTPAKRRELADLARQLPPEVFDTPLASLSISEFWAERWHQFLRHHFQAGLGHRIVDAAARPAIDRLLPPGAAVPAARRAALAVAGTAVAFTMSGLMHEYLSWAAWGEVSGRYMAFFGLHGLAVVAEGLGTRLAPKLAARVPTLLRRAYVVGFAAAVSPLFVETYRRHGYFGACAYHPLLAPVTATLLRRGGWCAAGCGLA
ncbi:hypothetical protein MNEG_13312 [Monoraphidium neglectum]|uniref:Wax synthase domain-containing protein n=1 Tax=Monoraphidium neglectum TaxID=145388 RepID=A0A0D2LSR9_9CHLO|nr:hypothetical protein MNEG_13312 [Monoraphidium neglectum]KIY94649.1 hypothetical protein MNEG_13312 [Monoraphidium neglectum]|eukprot:XP_013893669.1 hypothetical protein MNEG_13312 [Monoraphidium neglectum]